MAISDPEGSMTAPQDTAGLVAEWRKAMEGVTPGPWRPSRFGFQVVSDYPEPAWQSVVELTTVSRSEPDAEREMLTQQAIASWIARCSPAGISGLLAALTAKDSEPAEARAALEAEREACAKLADDNADNDSRGDSPWDNGAGSSGYRRACYDIAEAIRARTVLSREKEA